MFLFILSLILLAPLAFLLELINEIFSSDELRAMGVSLEHPQVEPTF